LIDIATITRLKATVRQFVLIQSKM